MPGLLKHDGLHLIALNILNDSVCFFKACLLYKYILTKQYIITYTFPLH